MKVRYDKIVLYALIVMTVASGAAAERTLPPFTVVGSAESDIVRLMRENGLTVQCEADALPVLDKAPTSSAVLLLAMSYPEKVTTFTEDMMKTIERKRLNAYVEYPARLPAGASTSLPVTLVWERGVVSSDVFGAQLPRLRILALHGASVLPIEAKDPWIVAARVAGFDECAFGLPEKKHPVLFKDENSKALIASTRLSEFSTGRFLPSRDWIVIWEKILSELSGTDIKLHKVLQGNVRPAYAKDDALPPDVEAQAMSAAAGWITESGLLVAPEHEADLHKVLATGDEAGTGPLPTSPAADGSCGILEGFSSVILPDGRQPWRAVLRADCNAESAMMLAIDGKLNDSSRSKDTARNLLNYVFSERGMIFGPYADPKHPAYGLIAWGAVTPNWMKATYGDDEARTILAAATASAAQSTTQWNIPIARALLANLETTGKRGFRGDRIDIPDLEKNGRAHYSDSEIVNPSPHFEAYLWACYLWAYSQTHHKPFLEKAKTAITATMEVFPKGWRWNDNVERAHMLLPLAWLVRVDDTPLHRDWVLKVADDLIALQQDCGAIREQFNVVDGGHLNIPKSNEQFGTGETPLIQQNGDPVSDQLYTTGFALLGLHEAFAAVGDPRLKVAEDKLAQFLCRIQIQSDKHKWLAGAWFRAFDFKKWEYWASSADAGWGPWCIEAGWGTAWIHCTLGLRATDSSLWDTIVDCKIGKAFETVRKVP